MDLLKILAANGVDTTAAEQIETAIKSQLHKEFIPKSQYNKKVQELDSIKEENDDLKARVDKPNEFEEKFNNITKEFENYKSSIIEEKTRSQKEGLLKGQLKEIGFENDKIIDLLVGKFDFSKLEVEENSLKGLDLENIKTEYADFVTVSNVDGAKPNTPPAASTAEDDSFLAGFNQF